MENAILIRQLDVLKVEIDFSNPDSINEALNARGVSTIHTVETQRLSDLLGVHLMGYVDRHGNDINNQKACEISGYDYLGSYMLLFKTDNKFSELPFDKDELERVYTYLVTGEIVNKHEGSIYDDFCKEYGIKPVLPHFSIEPEFFRKDYVPYVLIVKYDLAKLTNDKYEEFSKNLFSYSSILVNDFTNVDGVNLSKSGGYYLKVYQDGVAPDSLKMYILIQAKEEDGEEAVLISNCKSVIDSFFNEKNEPSKEHVDLEDALEEVVEGD